MPAFYRRPVEGGVRFDAQRERLADLLPALPRRVSHVFVLYGAIDMEGCARDPVGTAKVNVDSVVRMIDDVVGYGARVVYASTDYIFDGTRGGWREDDAATPQMEYGRQKLAIETYLRRLDAPWLATRFSKVVSGETGTHSLIGQWVEDIRAGREMRCASDQVFSPSFVDETAAVMVKLAAGGHTGLFNLAGPRAYSRLELLRLFVERIRRYGQMWRRRSHLSICTTCRFWKGARSTRRSIRRNWRQRSTTISSACPSCATGSHGNTSLFRDAGQRRR